MLLAHFAVRALMHEAAVEADLDPDRLSFVHAVRVIGEAMTEFALVAPAEYPRIYARLLGDLVAERLPKRRPRSNPRVVKRKMQCVFLIKHGGLLGNMGDYWGIYAFLLNAQDRQRYAQARAQNR